MSQSRLPLCTEFNALKSSMSTEGLKRVLEVAIPLYLNELLRNGRIEEAKVLIDKALSMGILADKLKPLSEKLSVYTDLQASIAHAYQLLEEFSRNPEGFNPEPLKQAAENIKNLASKAGVDVSQVLGQIEDVVSASPLIHKTVEFRNTVQNYIDAFSQRVKSIRDAGDLMDAYGYAAGVADNLLALVSQLKQAWGSFNPSTDTFKQLKNEMLKQVDQAGRLVNAVQLLSLGVFSLASNFTSFTYNLSLYGTTGSYQLSNTNYRNTLQSTLENTLRYIKYLESEVAPKFERDGFQDLASNAREIASVIRKALEDIKEKTARNDERFYNMWKTAESNTGVGLKPVSYVSVIPGLDAVVRDIAETNKMLFLNPSSPPWLKFLSSIGLIGSGAIDAVTQVIRPEALRQNIENLTVMLSNTYNAVRERGVQGFVDAGRALVSDMFGTPDRALYSLGVILGAIAVAEAVGKLPIPAKLKGVVINALQGDPVGLSIEIGRLASGKIASLVRAGLKQSGRVVEYATVIDNNLAQALVDSGLEKTKASQLAGKLRGIIARYVAKSSDVMDNEELLGKAMREGFIEDLDNIRRMLSDLGEADPQKALAIADQLYSTIERLPLTDKTVALQAIDKFRKTVGEALESEAPGVLLKAREELAKTLGKTELGKAIESIRGRIAEIEKVSVKAPEVRAPSGELLLKIDVTSIPMSEAVIKGLQSLDESGITEKLPASLRSIIDEIKDKALRGEVSVQDVNRLGEALSSLEPKLAGLTEIKVFKEFVSEVLEQAKKTPELVDVSKAIAVQPLPPGLLNDLNRLASMAEDLAPSEASALKSIIDKISREGLSESNITELFKTVDEVYGKVKPGLKESLSNLLDTIREKLGRKTLLEKGAEEISETVKSGLEETFERSREMLEKGKYGFIDIVGDIREVGLLDEASALRLKELLENPVVEKTVDVDGITVKFKRVLSPGSDGSLTLTYRFEFPEGRVLEIKQVTKGYKVDGKPYASLYRDVFFDPELRQQLIAKGSRLANLDESVVEDLIKQFDPAYSTLKDIVIYPVGKSLLESLVQGLSTALKTMPAVISLPSTLNEIKMPEVKPEIPGVKPPEVKPPEVKIPEITHEVPGVKTPEIKTPEVEIKPPEVKTPEIKVKTPEVEVPRIEAPGVKIPEISVPEVKPPEITAPEVKPPETKPPELKQPEVEIPGIKPPEVKPPEVEIKTPEIEIPKPEITVPGVDVLKSIQLNPSEVLVIGVPEPDFKPVSLAIIDGVKEKIALPVVNIGELTVYIALPSLQDVYDLAVKLIEDVRGKPIPVPLPFLPPPGSELTPVYLEGIRQFLDSLLQYRGKLDESTIQLAENLLKAINYILNPPAIDTSQVEYVTTIPIEKIKTPQVETPAPSTAPPGAPSPVYYRRPGYQWWSASTAGVPSPREAKFRQREKLTV